jgi:hypothetical protein
VARRSLDREEGWRTAAARAEIAARAEDTDSIAQVNAFRAQGVQRAHLGARQHQCGRMKFIWITPRKSCPEP